VRQVKAMSKNEKNPKNEKLPEIDEATIETVISDVEKIVSLMIMQGYDGITISSALLGVGKRVMTASLGAMDTKKAIERLAKFPDHSLINGNYTLH
tara:strand:+ start:267 stop:554 length:288 start_codon:yes stop_codon:yes gene_type:complete